MDGIALLSSVSMVNNSVTRTKINPKKNKIYVRTEIDFDFA